MCSLYFGGLFVEVCPWCGCCLVFAVRGAEVVHLFDVILFVAFYGPFHVSKEFACGLQFCFILAY